MIQVFHCDQNSPEWDELRRGIVTSSQFASVMMNGRGGKPSVTRRKYMLRLVSDRLGGQPPAAWSNQHTDRGHALELGVARLYAIETDTKPEKVGFVKDGEIGASPDFLIGKSGLLEVKTKLPELQLECLLADEFPTEHETQCQGQLWVCQREWVDLAVYWPGLPLFIKRAYRDERRIAEIKVAVDAFLQELNHMVADLKDRYAIAA